MTKTLLYARESVAFDKVLTLVDANGAPIDITGWTFELDLTRQAGSPDLTLDMNTATGDGGFAIVDGEAGELRMVVQQAALAGIDDTTGDFTLFGDLLGTAPSSSPVFVRDIRLNVTTAGSDFSGSTYEVALDAIGAVLKAELAAEVDRAEEALASFSFDSQITTGELIGDTTAAGGGGGGASASGYRLTIPLGFTGNGSSIRARLPVSALPDKMKDSSGNLIAGETIRIAITLDTSDPFTRATTQDIQIQKNDFDTVVRSVPQPLTMKPSDSGAGEWGFDYVAQGDERELRPRFTLAGNGGAASEEWLEPVSVRAAIIESVTPGESRTDRMLDSREALLAAELTPSTGNLVGTDAVSAAGSTTNGGYYSGILGRYVVPSGQTANDALIIATLKPPYKAWNGRDGIVTVEWSYSDNFNRIPDQSQIDALLNGATSSVNRGSLVATITDYPTEKKVVATFPYTFQGDEERLQFSLKLNGSGAAAAEQTIELTGLTVDFPAITDVLFRHFDLMLNERLRGMATSNVALRLATPLRAAIYTQIIRVAESGADHTSIKAAYDAITKRGPYDHVLIDVAEGVYDESEEVLHNGLFALTIKGRGPSMTRWNYNPGDGASASTIHNDSAFKGQGTFFLEGISIHATNARYGVHPESDGGSGGGLYGSIKFRNHVWGINNCEIAHLGNDDAINYNPAIRGLTTLNAIGSGTSAGAYYFVTHSYAWAKYGAAFACHNSDNFLEASRVDLIANTFRAGSASGRAISLGFLQSGRACEVFYAHNTIHGVVQIDSTDAASPIGAEDSRHSEIQITGYGNTPHLVYVGDEEAGEDHPYFPRITDEERELRNATGAPIARKTMLAFDGDMESVRPMTDADPQKLFAGVALQDIAAGEYGRVKHKGWLSVYRVAGLHSRFTASIDGTTMTVTDVAEGKLAVGDVITGADTSVNTVITALGTGTGGVGTYTVSVAQTRASSTLAGRKDFQFMSDHSIAAADPGTAETGGAQGLLTAVKETAVEVA